MNLKIETQRFLIRPFKQSDYKAVASACSNFELAKQTLGIPVPYTEQDAKNFIAYTLNAIKEGKTYELAITYKEDPKTVIGCMSLVNVKMSSFSAEIAYWISKEEWGKGVATECAKAIINFAFNQLKLHSIIGRHFDTNPASGKVMQKCGMTYVGKFRENKYRFGRFYDLHAYELLSTDKRDY